MTAQDYLWVSLPLAGEKNPRKTSYILNDHHRQALAKAELHAPAELQGAFIAAGHSFDAFAAVAKALGTATGDVFIIDPYADAKLLTDYAPLAPETVSVRVLTEATHSKD